MVHDTESGGPEGDTTAILRAGLILFGALLTISLLAGVAVADGHGSYVVEQDGETHTIAPLSDEETTAEDFYDYRAPHTDPHAYTYSSHGTMEYQQDDASILMLYEGPEGTSLIIVHDRYHEERYDGTPGGFASFDVSGLPTGGEWVVEDDDYDGQTDMFIHDGSESEMHWVWSTGRTDGAVFTGIQPDSEITIDPRFNDDALFESDDPREDGLITDWQFIDATDDGFDRVSLSSLEAPITIRQAESTELHAEVDAPDQSPVDEAVSFDASGSEPADEIAEYRWDFTGDGSIDETSETAVAEHSFDSAGTYNVAVTVVGEDGTTDTATITVEVTETLRAVVTASSDSVDEGEPISFDGTASVGEITEYEWSFGDGETATGAQVDRTYDAPGTYEVVLTVTDSDGQTHSDTATLSVTSAVEAQLDVTATTVDVGETVEFDASNSVGMNLTYVWSFDDGETESGPQVQHTYATPGEYEVTLTVTDEADRVDQETTTIEVGSPTPTASLTAPEETTVGTPVELTASQSTGFVDDVEYEWQIDNETINTTTEPTYEIVLEESGQYALSVTVTDSQNREDTATTLIQALEPLRATPVVESESIVEGESIRFNGTGSIGEITEYEWTFDDGETATGAQINRTFEEAGTYNVTLTVTDSDGQTHSNTTAIEVLSGGPTASLSVPGEARAGTPVELNASQSTGIDANATYEWSVDGEIVDTTTEPTTTAVFEEIGTAEISVTVTDGTEQSDTDTATLSVVSPVEARLEVNTTSRSIGELFEFDASSSTGSELAYEWSFGDGENATGEQAVYAFDADGEYTIELTVRDADGSADTVTTNVTVESDEDDGESSGGGSAGGGSAGSGSSGGSGGGSSGSAGSGGSSTPSEVTATVTEDDSGVVWLNATDVDSGVPIVAELELGDAIRLDSIAFESEDTHDELTVTLVRFDTQTPPGIPAEYAVAFELNATDPMSAIEYDFSVSAEAIESAGLSAENLSVYGLDDEWTALDSTIENDGERYRIVANVDETGVFGIGSSEDLAPDTPVESESAPDITLVDVSLDHDHIRAGESVTVTGVFENEGTALGEHQAQLLVEGSTAQIENVTLNANETATVTFTQRLESSGTFEIGIDDRTETVHVTESDENSSTETAVDTSDQGINAGLAFVLLIGGFGSLLAIGVTVFSRVRDGPLP